MPGKTNTESLDENHRRVQASIAKAAREGTDGCPQVGTGGNHSEGYYDDGS